MSTQKMSATKLELLDISHEINSMAEETANRLALQNKNINKISLDIIVKQKAQLKKAEKSQLTPIAQKVINHIMLKMPEMNDLLSEKTDQGKITRNGYIRYLIQAWYCSRHTPELQGIFHRCIAQYAQSFNEDKLRRGSKFIRLM